MARKFYPYPKSLLLFFSLALSLFSVAQNPIVTENALPGNPISEWSVPDFRDNRIVGFSTKMSLNSGETVHFKINVQSGATYTLKIYRLGYYGGNGARLMQNLGLLTGTIQPPGINDPATGMVDCSNWSESASWNIPVSAVSGFYIAKLERTGGGSNHIAFIVRNDASNSDLYLQFPDATWQAYNGYGGNSLYDGSTSFPGGHAVKVSYNRPFFPYNSLFNTDGREADWYMNAAYPMIRWLERNGYNVTYTGSNDVANNAARLLNHKVFISLGHDEYWSKEQRNNVEAALNAGVHLAFISGNEVYWKTRWESLNGGEHRTLVCYKEGTMGDGMLSERACGTKCDASTSEWTGLWRTGEEFDAGKPENALTGQMSWTETDGAIQVPAKYKKLRFWRNTTIPNLLAGQTATLAPNTLGFEWDFEQYFSTYHAARITMSSTTINNLTHKLSLYKHNSGALVFGAGTVQWSWGLDGEHSGGSAVVSPQMQQATVNIFADMGVQPATLQAGLITATKSTDASGPSSVIVLPVNGSSAPASAAISITGTAADAGGGVVAGVEVSTDGGNTWTQAEINTIDANITWSFTWVPSTAGPAVIKARAFDDSGNKQIPGAGTNITITPAVCPCTIFHSSSVPLRPLNNDGQGIELGVKFRTTQDGFITGIRYYKGQGTTGTHVGSLWTSTGTQLATATFINETASGWQQVLFASPVPVTAGTTYVASYHSSSGDYAATNPFFTQPTINGPLVALANGENGPNGVFQYSATPTFPANGFQTANYWVDIVFINPNANTAPVVVTHPTSQAVCTGKSVSFNSAANGKPTPTVQWQSSTNGTTWTNIVGATNSTLTLVATITDHNKQYRAVWSNSEGSVNSNAASLTVKPNPVLSSSLTGIANSGTLFSYTPTSTTSGTVFTWQRAAFAGISNPAATGSGNINETLLNTTTAPKKVTYIYTLTVNGCTNTQNVVVTVVPPGECLINTSIISSFNSTKIPAGRYIWFNSSLKPEDFKNTNVNKPIIIKITNSWITFKANGQQYTLKVPDSQIRFDSTVKIASARFINNIWQIAVPRSFQKDIFMAGLAYKVPTDLPGSISNIKWTADIGIANGVKFSWRWSAAVYTSFGGHGVLTIKPIDSNKENPYTNSNKEGTPENYIKFVVDGAKGKGKKDYTGGHSSKANVSCNINSDDGLIRNLIRQLPALFPKPSSGDILDVQVSPNPSNVYFNLLIQSKATSPATVIVSDVSGKVFERHEKIVSKSLLQMGSQLKAGIYFVTVIQGDQRKTVMIIKAL